MACAILRSTFVKPFDSPFNMSPKLKLFLINLALRVLGEGSHAKEAPKPKEAPGSVSILRLDLPPTPDYAPEHAETFVRLSREVSNVQLDYSLESLVKADSLLADMRRDGATIEKIPSTLFRAGCYTGEVLRRLNPSSKWSLPPDEEKFRRMFPFMVLRHVSGSLWAPINKAFAVLDSPETDSLHFSCSAELKAIQRTQQQ